MKLRIPMLPRPAAVTIFAAVLLHLAVGASAVPIVGDVSFDGAGGYGTSAATADASGIPKLSVDSLDFADALGVGQNFLQETVALGPPATATSDWTVTNNGATDIGTLYFVFLRPIENTIIVDGAPQSVNYAFADVGLTLQNGAGGFDWVLLEVPFGGDLYYYPAVSLGSLGVGQTTASPFQVDYILDNPQIFAAGEGFELGIPKWEYAALIVPVPEPATGLLFALGVAALAAGRRRCA